MQRLINNPCPLALFLVLLSGCATPLIDYTSDINSPARLKANIYVRFDEQKMDDMFIEPEVKLSIVNTIKSDLTRTIFYNGTNEVDVNVKIEKLTYTNNPWGLLWLPLVVIGLPFGKVEGEAQVYLEVRSLEGQVLGSYRAEKKESHWYNTAYYNKAMLLSVSGGATREALKLAIESMKGQLIAEKYLIAQALEKSKGGLQGKTLLLGNSDVDADIPRTSMKNPNAVAVVIGISDYQDPSVPKVDHAIQDALAIRQYLINVLGYDERNILPRDPAQTITAGVFKTLIRQQLPGYVKPGLSDVFVYYSGHGAPSTSIRKAFFVPADCNPNYVNSDNAYPLDDFYDDLSRLPCRSLNVVLDACFSGLSAKGEMLIKNASPLYLTVEHPLLAKENATLFASATSDQVSNWYPEKQHSLFTYFFLKGLQGAADTNRDGVITVQEMEDYVRDENSAVPYISRREYQRMQMPQVITKDKQKMLVKF
ncbi:MAG: caspase family protein [Ignavibacteriales bacterium]|nr:caspase family protein [Ignavibacteriales bacterium]